MNLHEYRRLQAEKGAIERMLAELPAEHAIDRIGLESRKHEIEEKLAAQPAPSREPARAKLTFRGKPIVGSHGIFAEFGAAAVNNFAEAVAAIGASSDRTLGSRGTLPNREEFRLLITGTAQGSFGFQLEEALPEEASVSQEALFQQKTPLEAAIEQTQSIMQASLGTDDELTEALAEADPRALDALRKFLDDMARNEAVCTLEFRDNAFRFADVEQLRRSSERLRQNNIVERDTSLRGSFLGVLPEHRRFEFQVADTTDVISGRVGNDIEDASDINNVIDQSLTIHVHTRQVGQGRPYYVLTGYETDNDGDPE